MKAKRAKRLNRRIAAIRGKLRIPNLRPRNRYPSLQQKLDAVREEKKMLSMGRSLLFIDSFDHYDSVEEFTKAWNKGGRCAEIAQAETREAMKTGPKLRE